MVRSEVAKDIFANHTCQDFLLRHTALRKGSRDGIPKADATTAKARAVVFLTYLKKYKKDHLDELLIFEQVNC